MAFAEEDYVRSYLNDAPTSGDSYLPVTDTFNITTTQNTITLSQVPTPYENITISRNSINLNPSTYSIPFGSAVVTFNFNLVNTDVVVANYSN